MDPLATNYWRRSTFVQAVRLTEENLPEIAKFFGVEIDEDIEGNRYIQYGNCGGYPGEWLVREENERYFFMLDNEFLKRYHTHSERMSEDEKYACVFALVQQAMLKQDSATYHQDGQGEMEVVAINTVNEILKLV